MKNPKWQRSVSEVSSGFTAAGTLTLVNAPSKGTDEVTAGLPSTRKLDGPALSLYHVSIRCRTGTSIVLEWFDDRDGSPTPASIPIVNVEAAEEITWTPTQITAPEGYGLRMVLVGATPDYNLLVLGGVEMAKQIDGTTMVPSSGIVSHPTI